MKKMHFLGIRVSLVEQKKVEAAAAIAGKSVSAYVRDALAGWIEKAAPPMFLIWSWQKLQWWRPARRGYTSDISEAGAYTFDEAAQVVVPHIPPGEEVAVLLNSTLRGRKDYRPPAYGGSS